MQVLQNNAIESWNMALKLREDLWRGIATLSNKKYFISSLQNAIELFFKQYLINKNDRRVIICNNKEIYQELLVVQDINTFLITSLNDEIKAKYIQTISFNEIKKLLNEDSNIKGKFSDFYKETSLIQALRNKETHFYINEDEFLTNEEFVIINNYMCDLWTFLNENGLLLFRNDGRITKISSFEYKEQLKKNDIVQKIRIESARLLFPTLWGADASAVSQNLGFCRDNLGIENEMELYSYVYMLMKYKILVVEEEKYNGEIRHSYVFHTQYA